MLGKYSANGATPQLLVRVLGHFVRQIPNLHFRADPKTETCDGVYQPFPSSGSQLHSNKFVCLKIVTTFS